MLTLVFLQSCFVNNFLACTVHIDRSAFSVQSINIHVFPLRGSTSSFSISMIYNLKDIYIISLSIYRQLFYSKYRKYQPLKLEYKYKRKEFGNIKRRPNSPSKFLDYETTKSSKYYSLKSSADKRESFINIYQ